MYVKMNKKERKKYKDLQLSGICYDYFLVGFSRLRTQCLDFLHYVHPLDDGTEDYVPVVQPGSLDCGDEKLRSVGVGSSIRHGHDTRTGVF